MRATPATNPIMVHTNKTVMMTRTKGIRMIPPPGCIISAKKDMATCVWIVVVITFAKAMMTETEV